MKGVLRWDGEIEDKQEVDDDGKRFPWHRPLESPDEETLQYAQIFHAHKSVSFLILILLTCKKRHRRRKAESF